MHVPEKASVTANLSVLTTTTVEASPTVDVVEMVITSVTRITKADMNRTENRKVEVLSRVEEMVLCERPLV